MITRKNKKTRSILFTYTLIFAAILVAILVITLTVNRLFLESFYNFAQQRAVGYVYEQLEQISEYVDDDTLRNELSVITEQYNMSIIILKDNTAYISVGVERTENFLVERLFAYLSGNIIDISNMDVNSFASTNSRYPTNISYNAFIMDSYLSDNGMFLGTPKIQVEIGQTPSAVYAVLLKEENNYKIYRSYDDVSGNQYLEAVGNINGSSYFLFRLPLESISRSVLISNRFYLIVGSCVAAVGIFVTFLFMRRITNPISDLTSISEKMSEQDFSAHYNGGYSGELDILGRSMNTMSENLEGTINELKDVNKELNKSIEFLKKSDEVRSEFISAISHDLKTPIALIQGYAEGLKDGMAADKENMDFYCDVITDEAARMNSIVQKFIALNELEYGNDKAILSTFSIYDFISDVGQSYAPKAESENIELTVDADHLYVCADIFMVEEALDNFILNAFHYVQDKGFGKAIRLMAKPAGDEPDSPVRVSVFNTGDGISEDDIDRIWEKLFRSGRDRSRNYGGNGIGLAIVKAIAKRHGTECGVYNTDNGPVFWLDLEAGAAESSKETAKNEADGDTDGEGEN